MSFREKARQAYNETVYTRTSAPFLLKYGSNRISNVGVVVIVIGATLAFAPFWIPIVTNWWGMPGAVMLGMMFAGGVILLVGMVLVRVSGTAWYFELREISNYQEVGFRQFLRYLFVGIKHEEVPLAPDGYSPISSMPAYPYNYQYTTQPQTVKPVTVARPQRKVPMSHKCPKCKERIMPGDELCTSCGERLS